MERKPPLKKSIYSPRYEAFLAQLRAARIGAKLSQRQAAKLLNRPQSFVQKSERNERRVDVLELIDFLKVYRVPLQEFIATIELNLHRIGDSHDVSTLTEDGQSEPSRILE